MDEKMSRIRELNDATRRNIFQERAFITTGVAALGPKLVSQIMTTVMTFDNFSHATDPHQNHDLGAFEADGHLVFFKIDYYDKDQRMQSPDPADGAVTERVITIMLAEEFG